MTQIATVCSLDGKGGAIVEVMRRSACGGDCKNCAGCSDGEKPMRVRVRNTAGADVGDRVVVESSTKKVLTSAAMVYILPIVLMALFYFLPNGGEGIKVACSFGGLALGAGFCVLYSKALGRKNDFSAEIVRIFDN